MIFMRYAIVLFILFVAGCNSNDDNVAGGPCTYQYDSIAAIVINIPAVDSNQFDIVLKLDKQHKSMAVPDTIHYYYETRQLLTAAALKDKMIQLNDTFMYISGHIISGSCNPADNRLILEHYIKE